MRVLFDARPGEGCLTGIGRYTRTVSALLASLEEHDCWSLGSRSGDVRLGSRNALEAELELPALLESEDVDVFHSPLFELPAVLPARAVVTIHDAIPAVRPELSNPAFTRLFARAAPNARRAALVVCPSESAKRDVVSALGVPQERIRVIPETPGAAFRVVDALTRAQVRKRHGLEGPFLLVVGGLEARKNPGVVLEALAQLGPAQAPSVVFAGPEIPGFDLAAESARRGITRCVHRLGVVTDEDLVALYNEALALVFPSRYEGFGLPIVEAFACETPVIASNAASIPEVAGDAAILFDPDDATALARAIGELAASPERREELRARGRARLEAFAPDVIRESFSDLYSELEAAP